MWSEGVQDQFVTTDLSTLLTGLYVKIEESLGRPVRPGRPPKLTDAELLTLAVAQVRTDPRDACPCPTCARTRARAADGGKGFDGLTRVARSWLVTGGAAAAPWIGTVAADTRKGPRDDGAAGARACRGGSHVDRFIPWPDGG